MKTTVWITGLSGSGKTTLSIGLKNHLKSYKTHLIDGDEIRKERPELGFSKQDRISNIYHATYKAMMFLNYGGDIAIVSLISPYEGGRQEAKRLLNIYSNSKFIEVYMNIPLDICEQRDPKGLYKMVREGKINDFTGISSPYEPPKNPDIIITPNISIDESVKMIYDKIIL